MLTTPRVRNSSGRNLQGSLSSATAGSVLSGNPTSTPPTAGESPPETAEEQTGSGRDGGDNEVLTILRGLQQQISAIQANQAKAAASPSPSATSSTLANVTPKRVKLPKDLSVSYFNA